MSWFANNSPVTMGRGPEPSAPPEGGWAANNPNNWPLTPWGTPYDPAVGYNTGVAGGRASGGLSTESPKQFDPNAPAFSPYAPGEIVRQPTGNPTLPGTAPNYGPNGPADYYAHQIYGDNYQTNPRYLADRQLIVHTADDNDPSNPSNPHVADSSRAPGSPGFNERAPAPGPQAAPSGTVIPSTPGDPTHGGLFDAHGNYLGGGASGGASGGSSITPSGQTDEASIGAWLRQYAGQAGADPSAGNDPNYWIRTINGKGGLTADNAGYFSNRILHPNQDRGEGGAGGSSTGTLGGTFGAFTAPFTGSFQAPRGTDDPGFQFAVEQGQQGIQRSAAAKGNLLTGGTLKDLASYTTGAALQDYSGAYNRAANTFGMNYDIFRNNQTDPYNKLMGAAGLGLSATGGLSSAAGGYMSALGGYSNGYAGNLTSLANGYGRTSTDLTTDQGNANAAGTVGRGNAINGGLNTLGNWFQNYYPAV